MGAYEYTTLEPIPCPMCGKMFVIPPENTYKLRTPHGRENYCSYHCYRKAQEKYEGGKKKYRRYDAI